jgi:hypothetical protein
MRSDFRSFVPTFVSASALLLTCIGGCATGDDTSADNAGSSEAALHHGQHEEPCPDLGETRCGDRCVNTQFDDANCGTCGNNCRTGGPTDRSTCFQGGCVGVCEGGFKCGDLCCPHDSVCCHHTSMSNMPSFYACLKNTCAGF